MPIGLADINPTTPDDASADAQSLPINNSYAYASQFRAGQIGLRAVDYAKDLVDQVSTPELSADEANQQYGVEGALRFNAPVGRGEAAFKSAAVHQKLYQEQVFARSNPNPLLSLGAGLAGGILDPVGLPLMLASDGAVGAGLKGAGAMLDATEAGAAVSKIARVANIGGVPGVMAEGAIRQLPVVGLDAFLSNQAGEDLSGGDVLRDMMMGAVLHSTMHYGGDLFHHLTSRTVKPAPTPDIPGQPVDPALAQPETSLTSHVQQPPDVMMQLPELSRLGAAAKAIDDVANGDSVDVGQYAQREAQARSDLNETTAQPSVPIKLLEPDVAVTPRGADVPVQYGVMELHDLITSHDNDLTTNPAFPEDLQPRDRGRAGSAARNYQLESEMNPKLLMREVSAASGAPIVSPDGVVESGNGRTIALRRSAMEGRTDAYDRYKAELAAQGIDTTGFQQPVLVRMRTDPMGADARVALSREMNSDVTERMSATEQAMTDAARLDAATISHLDEPGITGKRNFIRAFIDKVAPDQQNAFVAPDGAISRAGQQRIDAALVAKAYGEPRLVEALFETGDTSIRQIGQAMLDAAPDWARLRAGIDRGETPADLDLTPHLVSAVDLVRHSRDTRVSLAELISERSGQSGLFETNLISPETEAFLRMIYRDAQLTKPTAADKVADALSEYARQAGEFTPGPDLFGDIADAGKARQILDVLTDRYQRNDAGPIDILRPPGRSDSGAAARGSPGEARPPVLDLRQDGGGGERAGQAVPAERGQGAGPSEKPGAVHDQGQPPGLKPKTGAELVQADPELAALAHEVERTAAETGVDAPAAPAQEPDNIAAAMKAAAQCLIEEFGG